MSNRKFGCEFEFSTKFATVSKKVINFLGSDEVHIENKWHRSKNNKVWHLKLDSTTESELVTPVSTINNLDRICEVVNFCNKFKITKNDGFHIHIYAKDIPLKKLLFGWLVLEDQFFNLVPRYRRNKEHCYPLKKSCRQTLGDINHLPIKAILNGLLDMANQHHISFSIERFDQMGTVEIRIAEGTKDALFARHWILFCLAFIEWCKRQTFDGIINREFITFDEILNEFDIDITTYKYIKQRYKKFRRKRLDNS